MPVLPYSLQALDLESDSRGGRPSQLSTFSARTLRFATQTRFSHSASNRERRSSSSVSTLDGLSGTTAQSRSTALPEKNGEISRVSHCPWPFLKRSTKASASLIAGPAS